MVKKGYKQTEIGIIPEDWEISTLEAQYSITSSKRVFQSEWRDSGVPFYRAREIAVMGEGIPAPKDLYISEEMYERYAKQYGAIKENDVLITGVGTLGKVYVVKKDDRFYFKDGNIIWLQWNGQYSSQFLKQLYRTPVLTNQVFGNSGGSTVPTYTITNAKSTIVPCPDYSEQCEIAEVLSSVDTLIATIEKQISKKKAIKQGAMQELLTGKRRLPGFSGAWETRTLQEISAEMVDGPFGSNLKTEHYTTERQVRIIQLSNIGEAGWNDANVKYTTFSHAAELQRCIVQSGSILIAKMMPAGRAIICPDDEKRYILGSDVVKVVPNSSVDSRYLVYATKSQFYLDQIADDTQGSTRTRTSVSKLRKTAILFPTKDEQSAIADILSEMDMEIATLEEKLAKYRQVKQGMMQQLLTGKIRLV